MLEVLYKKAHGYDVEETNREYVYDEDGSKRIVKEKTSVRHIPPDLSALKAYMELKDSELTKMSNRELIDEKKRLLKELKKIKEGEKKENEHAKKD